METTSSKEAKGQGLGVLAILLWPKNNFNEGMTGKEMVSEGRGSRKGSMICWAEDDLWKLFKTQVFFQ